MNYKRWQTGIFLGISLIVLIAYAKDSAEPVYQDTIDTPARMSKLAERTLLSGIALAGKRLVAVGHRGHIIYSDDQGKAWTQSAAPVSVDLLAVNFPSDKNGWAVGHDGVVLHSADGGTTWVKQFDGRAAVQVMSTFYSDAQKNNPCELNKSLCQEVQRYLEQGPDKPFLDVWFENDTHGYIVGAFGLIFRTTDGGKSWVPLFDKIDNSKRYHLYAIKPIGSDLFICSEQGIVYKLDAKSGRFKEIQTPYIGTYFGITGKPGALLVYGMRGKVLRSGDGGASWKNIETRVPAGLTGAAVLEDGRIALVSQAGNILVSDDSGMTFKPLNIENPMPASAITALDKNTLVVAGFRGAKLVSIK